MTALDNMEQVIADRHGYARQWKARTGGKVVGYFCTYFPEEVLYAAGVLPVRIFGGHEPQDVTEPYVFSMYCPYARDCLAQGLLGRYDYLDGIAYAHSCAHIQQSFDSWRRHIPVEMSHFLFVPAQLHSKGSAALFRDEVEGLRSKAEKWLGTTIGNGDLARAIQAYNLNRRLSAEVYEQRKAHPPLITGTRATQVVLSSQLMDKEEHNRLLAQLLQEPSQPGSNGPRLLVMGSICDETEVIQLIESLGANVVADDHCTGTRYFQGEVSPDGDPVDSLVERYSNKPPCPVKDFVDDLRREHVGQLLDEFKVEGIVVLRQKFCDPHATDQAMLADLFSQRSIPTLSLELDFTTPLGQYRTRVEAFLEMMALEEVG